MFRFLAACGAGLALFAAGCAGDGDSSGEISRKEFQDVEKRVAALESRSDADGADLAKKVAELEKKLAAGGGSSGGGALAGLPAIGTMNPAKDVWKCAKVAKGPAVDGKLDDAAWKNAVQVKLISDDVPPVRIANDSTVVICHDAEKLYIGAVCLESEMDKLHLTCTKRDDKIYKDDCIEFYIDQQLDRNDAVKLVINANGVFMDFLRGTSGDAGDVTWNVEVKTTKLADRYVMEVAIPFKDMGLTYEPGKQIGFNPYRMRQGGGKKGEYTTWWGFCNDIVSIGGSGSGADAALILKPAHQNNFFDMRIREIVCKPRRF